MLKKLLAGLMAALTAGTGSGAATQADQFAENFVQEYVSDMEAGMNHVWNELNIEVSYKSLTKKECEKEIDLTEDEPADYTYYYKIEYTSDEINNQYEHYSNIDFTEFFTSLMQSLRSAKSDVYGNHHVWKYYDKVKKGVTTRVYILDQQYDHILTIYDEDHEHCYELIPYDDGDQLYIDGELVYTDDFMLQPSHIESNTSTSSGSSQNKKHYSGSSSSSSSKHKYTYSDPYDAEDYDNADDFAEEWAEEFGDGDYDDGYDDAYDYWEDVMD